MFNSTIIPRPKLRSGGLVKTVGLENPEHVGDLLNAVRKINEREVGDLIVLDIDATRENRELDYALIPKLAAECRTRLANGGGASTVQQFETLVSSGVEKVPVSSAAAVDTSIINNCAVRVERQNVVEVLDVRKKSKGQESITCNGKCPTGINAVAFAKTLEQVGISKIMRKLIDRDGHRKGYDLEFARAIRNVITRLENSLGGARSLLEIARLLRELGIIGAAACSLFIIKSVCRAVLINYPTHAEKGKLFAKQSPVSNS